MSPADPKSLPSPTADRDLSAQPGVGQLRPRQLLLVGSLEHAEFRWLARELADAKRVQRVWSVAAAEEWLGGGGQADWIILVQAYPGQWHAADWQRLRHSSPLSRLGVLLSSWSEGETRTGAPEPGVERWFHYELLSRLAADGWLREDTQPRLPAWLPTASHEERWQQLANRIPAAAEAMPLSVVICGRSRQSVEALAEVLHSLGHRVVQIQPSETAVLVDADAVIYDDDGLPHQRYIDVRRLRQTYRSAQLLALVDFPRHDEICALRRLGCDHVFGKPYLLADLMWACGSKPSIGEKAHRTQTVTRSGPGN